MWTTDLTNHIPWLEVSFCLVLIVITLFRRILSSNNQYRENLLEARSKRYEYGRRNTWVDGCHTYLQPCSEILSLFLWAPWAARNFSSEQRKSVLISDLSPELTFQILGYLETHEIIQFSSASKTLRRTVMQNKEMFWELLWLQTFGAHWHHEPIRSIRRKRGITWDPILNRTAPRGGWYRFYLDFEVSWQDWILAGFNSRETCLLAIDNHILDVTRFLPDHPGSMETLTERAGCNASDDYRDIGHSQSAELIKNSLTIWQPRQHRDLYYNSDGELRNNKEISQWRLHLVQGRRLAVPSLRLLRHSKIIQKEIVRTAAKYWANLRIRSEQLMGQNDQLALALAQLQLRLNNQYEYHSSPFQQAKPCVPGLRGYYYDCEDGRGEQHRGEAKACFDPLEAQWMIWWTCCGKGYLVIPGSTLDIAHISQLPRAQQSPTYDKTKMHDAEPTGALD